MSAQEKPLVTFGLLAFNQEQFIREAVAGAFAQTYSPLQIVLSDDGSPDKTFEIMQEMASQYQGPHQIVLNRNEPNLGIGGHINKVMSLAQGELIVIAAGDDYSLPHRTETLVDTWLGLNKKTDSLHSATAVMDEDSHIIAEKYAAPRRAEFSAEAIVQGAVVILGATHAWSRSSFERFGPLQSGCNNEDAAIALRSALAGGATYIDQVLVRYRAGGVSGSRSFEDGSALLNFEQKRWSRLLALWQQMLVDLNKHTDGRQDLRNQLQQRTIECSALRDLCESKASLGSLWRIRGQLNMFIGKHAVKLLFANVYVKVQPILNRIRRGKQ